MDNDLDKAIEELIENPRGISLILRVMRGGQPPYYICPTYSQGDLGKKFNTTAMTISRLERQGLSNRDVLILKIILAAHRGEKLYI